MYPEVELTPEQLKKWGATRAALVWHAPGFTHLFYTMMNKHGSEQLAVFAEDVPFPVAATDGRHILIKPSKFFELSLGERVFVVCHEISHGMFAHCELIQKLSMAGKVKYPDGKVLDFDNNTFQKALDYIINDMLIESKIGTFNPDWLHDTTKATHMDSALTVYRRIYEDEKKNGGKGGGSGGGKGQQRFDQNLKPGASSGQDPNQAAAGRNDMAWKTAIAGALASAKAQGKLPAALKRFFEEVLDPVVDWTDKVQGWLSRKMGGGSYNWRKPDRRLITRNIIAPARTGFGCGDVVVGVDTSGSVTDPIVAQFFAEMSGMLEDMRPARLFVMWCDAKVHRVDEVFDMTDLHDLKKEGAPGGGGTSFVPVFEKIQELGIEPDALIYLTDGDGTFPTHPPLYPVMWGDISHKADKYKWGDVIDLPLK